MNKSELIDHVSETCNLSKGSRTHAHIVRRSDALD